jgi:hypothetical protein
MERFREEPLIGRVSNQKHTVAVRKILIVVVEA